MRAFALLLTAASCGVLVPGSSRQPPAAPAAHTAPTTAATAPEPPPPPRKTKFDKSASDLEEAIASELAGYRKLGEPMKASLDAYAPQHVRVERGKCYGVVVRLDPGAEFGDHARQGSVDVLFQIAGESYSTGPGVVGPGAVGGGLCPQASAAALLDLQATSGRAQDKTKLHELGHGAVTLQLYTRAIDHANLARRKTEERDQVAATKASVDARHRQEAAAKQHVCTTCKTAYDDCIADWRRGATKKECIREYANCAHDVSVGQYTWDYCGTADPR